MWKLIRMVIWLGLIAFLCTGGLENNYIFIKNAEALIFKV